MMMMIMMAGDDDADNDLQNVAFEVLTAVTVKRSIFWVLRV
jgi:hypothetical protein